MTTIDAELAAANKTNGRIRAGFYGVVLATALVGQATGIEEQFNVDWWMALPPVAALELGGVVFMSSADIRRRMGESALASRLISAAFALGATAFNAVAHDDKLLAAFFAGMSLAGYAIYLINAGNKRRDRLRAEGKLSDIAPTYGAWQWLRHPWLTRRARALALTRAEERLIDATQPVLGKLASLSAAADEVRTEQRHAALSKVLHAKISATVGSDTADIATAVYDLDEIARRVAARADYDGLTDLIATDLAPAKLTGGVAKDAARRDDIDALVDAVSAPTPDDTEHDTLPVAASTEQHGDSGEHDNVSPPARPVRATAARHTTLRRPRRMAARPLPPIHVTVAAPERSKRDTPRDTVSSRKATSGAKTTAERVADAVAKNPTIAADILASKLGVSVRTVQRHMPRMNGSEVHA